MKFVDCPPDDLKLVQQEVRRIKFVGLRVQERSAVLNSAFTNSREIVTYSNSQ